MAIPELAMAQNLPESLSQTSRLLRMQDETTSSLFSAFFQTPQSKDILAATTACMEFVPQENTYSLGNYLAGRIFEELSTIYLQRLAGPQFRFLTSDEFVKLYRELNPNAKINSICWGISHGIIGRTFPDIIKLRNAGKTWQATEMYECKLQLPDFCSPQLQIYKRPAWLLSTLLHISDKYPQTSQRVGQTLNSVFPDLENKPLEISPKLKFKLIVPNNTPVNGKYNPIFTPINSLSFSHMINTIMRDCRASMHPVAPRPINSS